MTHFGTNDRLACGTTQVTQVCMDFGEELKKRKTQVTKVLRDPSNPMNQRRQKVLVLHCNISEEERAVQVGQAASF